MTKNLLAKKQKGKQKMQYNNNGGQAPAPQSMEELMGTTATAQPQTDFSGRANPPDRPL